MYHKSFWGTSSS